MKKINAKSIYYLLLFVGFTIVCYGLDMHYTGYHNMDLGQNLRWLNAEYDLSLADEGTDLQVRTAEEWYHLGVYYYRNSIWFIMAGMYFLTAGAVLFLVHNDNSSI